jgi:hypothetical protein
MVDIIRSLLLRELATYERELALFPSDEAVWQTPPGVTNSAGTLVLHVCGNLRHFVGAQLGGSGYRRDRDAEFSRRGVPRAALLDELRAAREEVDAALARLPAAALAGPYPLEVLGVRPATGGFLAHLAAHLAYHLGQLDAVRRVVTGDATAAGALPIAALAPAASPGPAAPTAAGGSR